MLNCLFHNGVQFLGCLLRSLVGFALISALGICFVAKDLSLGLVAISLLETWLVLIAVSRGVVRPSMVVAVFLLLGVRRLVTLFGSSLGVVGFLDDGLVVFLLAFHCFTVLHENK